MHKSFRIPDLATLRSESRRLDIEIPLQEDVSPLFRELRLRTGHVLANRLAVQPMEGADSEDDGAPGPLTFRRYRRFASGGCSLIWFEACAVCPEGRSNPHQLWINQKNVGAFKKLVSETRAAASDSNGPGRMPVLVLQLTHSGRYAKPRGEPAPVIVHHSPELDRMQNLPADYPLVSDDELDRLQISFLEAAKLASLAGFDGVDIKSCHGYLLSELLGAHTRTHGKYGGPLENRTRFLKSVVTCVSHEIGGIFVTTRLGVFDALPHPFGFGISPGDRTIPDLKEPLNLVHDLARAGLPLLNLSIGVPHHEPHYGRPYDIPLKGAPSPPEHPLKGVSRFLSVVAELQKAEPQLPMVGSGYSWLRQHFPQVGAASIELGRASIIGLGRNAIAYPDFAADLESRGAIDRTRTCTACSGCSELLRSGRPAGCVVRDGEIYVLR